MAGRTRKTRRLIALGGAGAALSLAVGLVLMALRDDIVFFR
jgi:cytochrome c-type biogenesis protein CcmE